MSLIDDALKAAQREKSRRESKASRPFAPVLVKLRGSPRPVSRSLYLVVGAGALVMATSALIWARFDVPDPLPNVPPVTSTILREALSDSVPAGQRGNGGQPSQAADPGPYRAADAPAALPAPPERVAVRAGVPAARQSLDTAAILQAAPLADAPGDVAAAPQRVQAAAGVQIAVEMPRDASALFTRAIAAHRAGNLAVARSLYERVLAINPVDGDALNNLGVLLSAEREFDRALELLRRAATAAPLNAGAWNNIGTVLREQGKGSDAVAAFRHALMIDPRHQAARVGLAQQYLAGNSPALARDLLVQVLLDNPALAEAHYTLGQVLELQGDRAGAIASYSSFVRVAPPTLAGHAELVRRRIDALASRP